MKKVKQINNLTIKFEEINSIDTRQVGGIKTEFNSSLKNYSVFTPDGKCLEDRLTLQQAENFCKSTTDFIRR